MLRSLLAQLSRVAAGGSTLAVSLSVDSGSPERAARRAAFQAAVAAVGEPARLVVNAGQAGTLLEVTGWRAQAARPGQPGEAGEAGEPGDSGELDAAARRRSAGFSVAMPA